MFSTLDKFQTRNLQNIMNIYLAQLKHLIIFKYINPINHPFSIESWIANKEIYLIFFVRKS